MNEQQISVSTHSHVQWEKALFEKLLKGKIHFSFSFELTVVEYGQTFGFACESFAFMWKNKKRKLLSESEDIQKVIFLSELFIFGILKVYKIHIKYD